MQASQASNETRLPRAVLRRSAAITARLEAQRAESEASSAAPAPPASPSADAAPPAEPTPPTVVAPPAEDPRHSDPLYWKQRFDVTAGVLRAEREARAAEVAEFNRRLADQEDQIRALQAQLEQPQAPDLTQILTKDQIETLGEDEARAVVDTALSVARDAARKAIEAEIKPLRDAKDREQARARVDNQAAFLTALAEEVPDFNEVNASEGWLAWLAQDDETTGVQRQILLDQHVGRGDSKRVAGMLKTYKKLAEGATPTPPITPQGSGAAMPGTPPPQQMPSAPTKAEIKDYYKRAALGKVKDSERQEFEARMKLRAGR